MENKLGLLGEKKLRKRLTLVEIKFFKRRGEYTLFDLKQNEEFWKS